MKTCYNLIDEAENPGKDDEQEECKFLPRPSHPFKFPDELQTTIRLEPCDLGGHKIKPSRPEISVVNLVLFTLTGYWKPHIGY